jgi:hypothetical protein
MKLLSHSVCSSLLNLPLCFLSSLLPRVLASQANAGFTTTNWNPTRGVKFTMAWSGTSDAGLKNITLFDCDSSGNRFAVFGPIASMSFSFPPFPICFLLNSPSSLSESSIPYANRTFLPKSRYRRRILPVDPTHNHPRRNLHRQPRRNPQQGKRQRTFLQWRALRIRRSQCESAAIANEHDSRTTDACCDNDA